MHGSQIHPAHPFLNCSGAHPSMGWLWLLDAHTQSLGAEISL